MQPTMESVSAPDTLQIPNAFDNVSASVETATFINDDHLNIQSPPTTTDYNRSLRIFYSNAGGMRSKVASFHAAVSVCEYEVIIITETWLVPSVLDSELTPRGWQIFRRDRHREPDSCALGGGVLIMVRDNLFPSMVITDVDDIEHV